MITTINQFKNESYILEKIVDTKILTSKCIDISKLEQYATALLIICGGEYGNTYYNPSKDAIFICLGNANPFDEEYLEDFIKQYISISYKTENDISIEIDMECGPNSNEDGWLIWNGKKWNTLNY